MAKQNQREKKWLCENFYLFIRALIQNYSKVTKGYHCHDNQVVMFANKQDVSKLSQALT